MSSRALILTDADSRREAVRAIWDAQDGMQLTLRERSKTDKQRALFHVLLTELSRCASYKGRRYTIDEWKDIVVGGKWGWTTIQCPLSKRELVIRRSTEGLTVAEYSDLIAFTYAEAQTVLGHVWADYRPGDPEWEWWRARGRKAA